MKLITSAETLPHSSACAQRWLPHPQVPPALREGTTQRQGHRVIVLATAVCPLAPIRVSSHWRVSELGVAGRGALVSAAPQVACTWWESARLPAHGAGMGDSRRLLQRENDGGAASQVQLCRSSGRSSARPGPGSTRSPFLSMRAARLLLCPSVEADTGSADMTFSRTWWLSAGSRGILSTWGSHLRRAPRDCPLQPSFRRPVGGQCLGPCIRGHAG